MKELEGIVLFMSCVIPGIIMFTAFFIYLPIYAYLLKKRDPILYSSLGGSRMFWPASFGDVLYFFCKRKYLNSKDLSVVTHGKILTWALGYTGVLVMSSFAIFIVYHFLKYS